MGRWVMLWEHVYFVYIVAKEGLFVFCQRLCQQSFDDGVISGTGGGPPDVSYPLGHERKGRHSSLVCDNSHLSLINRAGEVPRQTQTHTHIHTLRFFFTIIIVKEHVYENYEWAPFHSSGSFGVGASPF